MARKRQRFVFMGSAAFLFALAAFSPVWPFSIDLGLAAERFHEAEACSLRDNGKTWGIQLYGPILFFDSNRRIAANQPDKAGLLQQSGDIFVGEVPANVQLSNSVMELGGVRWATVSWPLPKDEFQRNRLLMHESFHRIQTQLPSSPEQGEENGHLDTLEGRFWLLLEFRALKAALKNESLQALEDAVVFRWRRYELIPGARKNETALEMNEGLAEYTGFKLASRSEKELFERAYSQLCQNQEKGNYVRAFAYYTGMTYGIILDRISSDWRENLDMKKNFSDAVKESLLLSIPSDLKAEAGKRAGKYDGDSLWISECEYDEWRKKMRKEYITRLVENPVLSMPLTIDGNFSFENSTIFPLEKYGVVYRVATFTDKWGTLRVSKGALLIREGSSVRIQVPAPEDVQDSLVGGDGWSLELVDPAWKFVPGPRKGDYFLKLSR